MLRADVSTGDGSLLLIHTYFQPITYFMYEEVFIPPLTAEDAASANKKSMKGEKQESRLL